MRSGLTQRQLAVLSGVRQPNIAAYERGRRTPTPAMLDRLVRAARRPSSATLDTHRDEVISLASQFRARDVSVFGSVAQETDDADSDLDLLVTFDDDATLLDQVALIDALSELLGVRVDVVSRRALAGPHWSNLDAVPV